jgi:hypothetical protein
MSGRKRCCEDVDIDDRKTHWAVFIEVFVIGFHGYMQHSEKKIGPKFERLYPLAFESDCRGHEGKRHVSVCGFHFSIRADFYEEM